MKTVVVLSLVLSIYAQLFEKLAREQNTPKEYDSFANILKQKGQQPMQTRSLFDKLAGDDHIAEPMRFQQQPSVPVIANAAAQVYLDLSQKGVEVASHKIKLSPEVELQMGGTKVMVRELEAIINFNRKLMERYGSNLEKCQGAKDKQEGMSEMAGAFRFSQSRDGEGADKMADSLEHELLEIG